MPYYLKGDYYYDIDYQNQLRIAGPQNHLLLGLSFPNNIPIKIITSEIVSNQLHLQLLAETDELKLTLPLVTDIRTLRHYTEPVNPTPAYHQLVEQDITELLPDTVEMTQGKYHRYLICKNHYVDNQGTNQEYGALIGVDKQASLSYANHTITISGPSPITIWVETVSTIKIEAHLPSPVFRPSAPLPTEVISEPLQAIYQMAGEQVEYLIRTKKTSGFEYGTIFPRDWIESADLGKNDLTQDSIDYMYRESLINVTDTGEGWHEDVVGQYKTRLKNRLLHVDRKMIDIEPKYILGLKVLSTAFLTEDGIKQRFRLIAQYVISNANDNDVITFKRLADDPNRFHFIGNWRDSYQAFPRQKSPLAPYDVNCVLYPEALRLIQEHADYFNVKPEILNPLLEKWSHQKNKYRLYHPGDIVGYSLALHGLKRLPLPIAHIDEAYDLFYAQPSMEEVVSLARKLTSDEFFYTPVGPLLVASDEDDFSHNQYHGKVIWPKQSAYCVAGLTRQYFRGLTQSWPSQVLEEIKTAALITAEASFNACLELQAVPELYYYDAPNGRARFYTDQPEYEGQMSLVQLWSSIGFRRMVRDYVALKGYHLSGEVA